MERFSPLTSGKEWCEQCESLKTAPAARACESQFCKLAPLLAAYQKVGFAQSTKSPVDVAPELVARVKRLREQDTDPAEKTARPYTRKDADGMTPKARKLLEVMRKQAGPDGTVRISFNDVFDEIGCTAPSSVSPIMNVLVKLRKVTILQRKGGRTKTHYSINDLATGDEEAPEPTEKLRELMAAPSPFTESCDKCRFSHCSGIGSMICRRSPPSSLGYPTVKPGDWCGEFQKLHKTAK